jgi:hypothetical protein
MIVFVQLFFFFEFVRGQKQIESELDLERAT